MTGDMIALQHCMANKIRFYSIWFCNIWAQGWLGNAGTPPHTSNGSITCLSTNNKKWKGLGSLTIYKTLPRVQDRSWGNKLLVEVHEELLVGPRSPLQKIDKVNVSTKVLNKTYITSNHTCISIKRQGWVLLQQANFDSVAILFYDYK